MILALTSCQNYTEYGNEYIEFSNFRLLDVGENRKLFSEYGPEPFVIKGIIRPDADQIRSGAIQSCDGNTKWLLRYLIRDSDMINGFTAGDCKLIQVKRLEQNYRVGDFNVIGIVEVLKITDLESDL